MNTSNTNKTGVLLINLGTPSSFHPSDVARYLKEFLLDPRVIDYSWIFRQALVRFLIVPLRKKRIAKVYESIWLSEGSPLLVHSQNLRKSLQEAMGENFHIELAMRYQSPSIADALTRLKQANIDTLLILPLFPQYASATTGSIFEKVMKEIQGCLTFPKLIFINHFFSHPLYIEAMASLVEKYQLSDYDKILFSFHGLPERQIRKCDSSKLCLIQPNCCTRNTICYRAHCKQTAQLIAEKLKIPPSSYTVAFQSRLGKEAWLKPYMSDTIKTLAVEGTKKLLVISPSFVADCLETVYEIGVELEAEFRHFGGERLDLVQSLNAESLWVDALKKIITIRVLGV